MSQNIPYDMIALELERDGAFDKQYEVKYVGFMGSVQSTNLGIQPFIPYRLSSICSTHEHSRSIVRGEIVLSKARALYNMLPYQQWDSHLKYHEFVPTKAEFEVYSHQLIDFKIHHQPNIKPGTLVSVECRNRIMTKAPFASKQGLFVVSSRPWARISNIDPDGKQMEIEAGREFKVIADEKVTWFRSDSSFILEPLEEELL